MTKAARQFKDALYGQLARIGKAVSAPTRIELLELLCQGPRTVEVIARQVGISVANASQHLRILHAARLVEADKRGLYVQYRIADERVMALLHQDRRDSVTGNGAIPSLLKSPLFPMLVHKATNRNATL